MPLPHEQFAFAVFFVGCFLVAMLVIAFEALRPAQSSRTPPTPGEVSINRFEQDRWSTSRILGKLR